ncbi:MAG: hypothetical protein M1820_003229 [Bogoriella megaspora]|nr:MAG: hypothetical protein M1820_003229 [Bogoriella megaspora]
MVWFKRGTSQSQTPRISDEELFFNSVARHGTTSSPKDFVLEDVGQGEVQVQEEYGDEADKELFIGEPLEALFAAQKPKDMTDKEAQVVTGLIREILQYDLKKRPTAIQLLEHPWFKD